MAVLFVGVLLFRPRRFRRAGVFAGIFLACLAPWALRNAVVADYYGFSSFATDSAFKFSAPRVTAAEEGKTTNEAKNALEIEEFRYITEEPSLSVGALAHWRARRAREVILSHPGTFAKIHVKGCGAFFLPGATDVLETAGVARGQRGTLRYCIARGFSRRCNITSVARWRRWHR